MNLPPPGTPERDKLARGLHSRILLSDAMSKLLNLGADYWVIEFRTADERHSDAWWADHFAVEIIGSDWSILVDAEAEGNDAKSLAMAISKAIAEYRVKQAEMGNDR